MRVGVRVRWAVAGLVVMLFTLGALGMGASAAAAAGHRVPFRGAFAGVAVANAQFTVVTFGGTGEATQLGTSTNDGIAVVTGLVDGCPDGSQGFANTNTETLTAANGDTLTFTSHNVACPSGPGMIDGTGEWVVTGGTGRFRGATGQGTFDGHHDVNRGVFDFRVTGTISAPNGD